MPATIRGGSVGILVLAALLACTGSDVPPITSTSEEDGTGEYRIRPLVSSFSEHPSYAYAVNDSGVVVGSMGGRPVRWIIDESSHGSGPEPLLRDGVDPGPGEARSVNGSGMVVGWYGTDTLRAFVWTQPAGMRVLGPPPGLTAGIAHDINDDGEIVGSGSPDPAFRDPHGGEAVRWSVDGEGAVVSTEILGSAGGVGAGAHAINGHGDVVGVRWIDAYETEGVLWIEDEGPRTIPITARSLDLDDRRRVAGAVDGRAAVWSEGRILAVAPSGSVARGLNGGGLVVGDLTLGDVDQEKGVGFVLNGGDFSLLEGLSAIDHTRARAISGSGLVVGESHIPEVGVSDAVFWILR
ncbi:MAG: hypothetical protein R3304_11120 [Longimicrobiales bacterium]|nr:hypothetical protein [Longimicrobiales bacterium]